MNSVEKRMKNLVPLNKRPKEKRLEIQKKGGRKSAEKRKINAQKKVERESILELVEDFIYSPVTDGELLQFLEHFGVKDKKRQIRAMLLIVSAIEEARKKGDYKFLFEIILKIMELFGETGEKTNSEEDKAFNNLIEAVKNVRKSKRKTT